MSSNDFDDQMVIESTPVRTIRNLKNRQSHTSIHDDESEDSQEIISSIYQPSGKMINSIQTNGQGQYDFKKKVQEEQELNQEDRTIPRKNMNMEEYIKKVEKFSNEVKPNFKRKNQQHTSATVIQIRKLQSQDENTIQYQQSNNGAEYVNSAYGGDDATSESRKTGSGASSVVPVSSYLKSNSQNTQQLAYGQKQTNNESQSSTLIPFNDQTNYVQSNIRRPSRKYKTKIGTINEIMTAQNNFNGRDENGLTQTENKMQYVNIDMEYALHFVMSKSRLIREKMENENISQEFINRSIMQSRSFKIEYNMYLQKLVNHKVLNPEFKNVSKKMFEKLEKFFINRLEKEKESILIHANYVKQSQTVQSLLNNRMQMLLNELNNDNKIQISSQIQISQISV